MNKHGRELSNLPSSYSSSDSKGQLPNGTNDWNSQQMKTTSIYSSQMPVRRDGMSNVTDLRQIIGQKRHLVGAFDEYHNRGTTSKLLNQSQSSPSSNSFNPSTYSQHTSNRLEYSANAGVLASPISVLTNTSAAMPASSRSSSNVTSSSLGLNRRLQTVMTQLAASEEKVLTLEAELKAAVDDKCLAERRLTETLLKNNDSRAKSEELANILGTLEKAVTDLEAQNKTLEEENKRMKDYTDVAESNVQGIKDNNEFLTNRNTTLIKKCETLCEEKAIAARKIEQLSGEIVQLSGTSKSVQKELQLKEELLEKTSSKLSDTETRLRSAEKAKSEAEGRVGKLETSRKELEEKGSESEVIRGLSESLRKHKAENMVLTIKLNKYAEKESREVSALRRAVAAVGSRYETEMGQLKARCSSLSENINRHQQNRS